MGGKLVTGIDIWLANLIMCYRNFQLSHSQFSPNNSKDNSSFVHVAVVLGIFVN